MLIYNLREDEYCSLKLTDLVDGLQKLQKDYKVDQIKAVTPEYIENLKQELLLKQKRLEETRQSNFRDLAKQEELENQKKAEEAAKLKQKELEDTKKAKTTFFSKLKKFFSNFN